MQPASHSRLAILRSRGEFHIYQDYPSVSFFTTNAISSRPRLGYTDTGRTKCILGELKTLASGKPLLIFRSNSQEDSSSKHPQQL